MKIKLILFRKKISQKILNFISRQQRPFKINMINAAGQKFLRRLTRDYQSIFISLLGVTVIELGIVTSIGGLLAMTVALPIGLMIDRYGIKKLFLLGTLIMALSSMFFVFAFTWISIIFAVCLFFLANQLLDTACPMVCGTYLKNEERATGKQLCDTVSAVPQIISPMVAASLIALLGGLTVEGIRPLYLIRVIGLLFLSIFIYKFYFDTVKKNKISTSNILVNIKYVFKNGIALKRWLLYTFLSSSTNYISLTYLYLYVRNVKGGNEFVIGSMISISLVVTMLFGLLIGRVADTFGRKKALYITIPLYCTSLVFLIYAQNTIMLLVSAIFNGFYIITFITQGAITAELLPVSLLGRWYGIINLVRGTSSFIAPLIGGLIWESIGATYVFVFIILIETSKLFILLFTIPETLKIRKQKKFH